MWVGSFSIDITFLFKIHWNLFAFKLVFLNFTGASIQAVSEVKLAIALVLFNSNLKHVHLYS
jgi:hypothetical protein